MKNIDIYLRNSPRYIDAYLNELTSGALLTAHNKYVILSSISKLKIQSPAHAKPQSFTVRGNIEDPRMNTVKELHHKLGIEPGLIEAMLNIELQKIQNIICLSSEPAYVNYVKKTSGSPNTFTISLDDPVSCVLAKRCVIDNVSIFNSSIDPNYVTLRTTTSFSNKLTIKTYLANSSRINYTAKNIMAMSSSLVAPTVQETRKFKHLNGTSFNDVTNITMEEFIVTN